MNHSILKPGTGTNRYYAKKHGEPPTLLEKLGLVVREDEYRPSCSCPVEVPRPASSPALTPGSEETFATRSPQPQAAYVPGPSLSETLQALTPEEMEKALQPGHGWTLEDSIQQTLAFHHCQGSNGETTISCAFDESNQLGNSGFSKTGWAAAMTVGGVVTAAAGILLTGPLVGLGLAVAGLAVTFSAAPLLKSSRRDQNDSSILSDMATRLHQHAFHTTDERHTGHGDYPARFSKA